MTLSDVVTLIGLALGTVGAVLLAYDVVYGPGKAFQASVIKTKLQNMKEFRALNRRGIEHYPQPPYTKAEIQKFLDDEERDWGPQERDLAEQDAEFIHKYENRVVTLGAFGVLLIVGGFVLQIAGLLIHAYWEKEPARHEQTGVERPLKQEELHPNCIAGSSTPWSSSACSKNVGGVWMVTGTSGFNARSSPAVAG